MNTLKRDGLQIQNFQERLEIDYRLKTSGYVGGGWWVGRIKLFKP
jgi:hypothetical protein